MSRILVVTTVHDPDDTRIRERLIRTLSPEHEVLYASKPPGPADQSDHRWIELKGGRLARVWRALVGGMRANADIVVLHDPELIPVGLALRLFGRRRRVVFDLHESLPDQILTKEWIPRLLRPGISVVSKAVLWVADRFLEVTVAEPAYQRWLKHPAPVFENYPRTEGWPAPAADHERRVVYVGDVTEIRGVLDLVRACGLAEVPLSMVGPADPDLRERIAAVAIGEVEYLGRLPNPQAMAVVRRCAVGVSPLWDVPNYHDALPTKVLEYLANGVPAVATDLPGTRRLVEGLGAVGLVRPRDIAAMKDRILEMLEPEAQEEARLQVEKVRSLFSWPEDRVLAFYRS